MARRSRLHGGCLQHIRCRLPMRRSLAWALLAPALLFIAARRVAAVKGMNGADKLA